MKLTEFLRQKMNAVKYLSRIAILSVMKVFYFPGKRFYCPCCGHSLRRFMHYDYRIFPSMNPALFYKYHKKIQCPYCDSLPRHRIMAFFLQLHPELIKNKKIVVFGMYQAEKTFFQLYNIPYTSADLCSPEAHLKENLTNLSFSDDSVDVLICHHVLEHVDNVNKALSEIHRVLRPGGIAILSVPMNTTLKNTLELKAINTAKLRYKYYGQTDHLRLFGKNVPVLIRHAGFKVYTIDGNKLPPAIHPVVGPASTDINHIYLCRKVGSFKN